SIASKSSSGSAMGVRALRYCDDECCMQLEIRIIRSDGEPPNYDIFHNRVSFTARRRFYLWKHKSNNTRREVNAMLRSFFAKEDGQGLVEYALILVLIAIVVIGILTLLGGKVSQVFSSINSGLNP